MAYGIDDWLEAAYEDRNGCEYEPDSYDDYYDDEDD